MKLSRTVATAAIAASTIAGVAFATGPSASAAIPARCTERADGGTRVGYALTADQRLVCFKISRPSVRSTLMNTFNLSGADTSLVGIDVRPSNNMIYGLGNAGGLYLLDPANEKPELKARMNVALEGRNFGMDFNPTVDRLRVVSDSGQNLRINVDTGATTVDAFVRNGANRALGVGGVAYTNNDNDASTATTLYDLDTVADQLVTQTPPNEGTLVPVGRLGFQGNSAVAFDIMSTVTDGKATDNVGYAALDGGQILFSIDLKTGAATAIGHFGTPVVGLTFGM